MRDWLTAFRPASFRGVGFKIEMEDASGARRLSVSPIAYADQSVIEDMGGDPRHFSLRAYVAGDAADGQAKALASVLSQKGAGLLVLPMLGAIRARVTGWRLSREKRVAGFVGFDIDLIEEGLSSVPFGPVAGAAPIANLFASGISSLGAALASVFPAASLGRETVETIAASAGAARIASIAADMTLGAAIDADTSAAIDALAPAASNVSADPSGFASSLVTAWSRLSLFADPASARQPLGKAVSGLDLGPETAGMTGIAEATAMAGALSILTVRGSYAAQQDAAQARKSLGEIVSPVIAAAGSLGDDVFAWIGSVTGEASLALSRVAASRAPLVRVETEISLSAVRAAYDLYGDANRAGELVDRNHVATPVFMPVSFEALAE